MFRKKRIAHLAETTERQTDILDRLQAQFDAHKSVFSEDRAWEIQADIDRKRFDVELDKLALTAYRPK